MKTNIKPKQLFLNHFRARAPRFRWAGLALWLGLLNLGLADDPDITRQPTNQTVSLGGNTMFRVAATTTNFPITFQWQHSATNLPPAFTNLPSATINILRLTNVVAEQAGDYRAIAYNGIGNSVTSQVATLTIDPTFIRINEGPGGTDSAGSVGAAWADYDGDGYPDLFIANYNSGGSARNALWHNDGDGTFTKITTNSPALATGAWWYPYWVDYDNDGDFDLHVLAYGSALDRFYRNDGNGLFTPDTPEFVKTTSFGELCSWSDFDNDGWLDVFIPRNNGRDLFFRGAPSGSFRSMTTNDVGSVVQGWSYCLGATFDYDNDGWQDLLVAPFASGTSGLKCRLYHNESRGFFRQITEGGLANQTSTFPGGLVNFAVGDYDNDGDFDLMVTGGEDGYRGRLYRNDSNGNFTNVATVAGVDRPLNGGFPVWADYDNDGDLDLLIVSFGYMNFPQRYGNDSVLFRNNGDGTFTSVEIGSPLRDGVRKFAYTWVDYDHDGFLDLFLSCGFGTAEPNYLYRNNLPATGNTNHWLKVRLVGKASNSMGVGAKVRVTATIGGKTVTQLRQITVPGSLTEEDYLAHFGLGDATKVDTLRIEWPSGIVQELTDVAVDQHLTKVESQNPNPLQPPQITASGHAADGTFQATVTCAATNLLCVFEASTNLVQWTKLSVRTNTTGTVQFDDPGATNRPARFYRVVVP
jgi:hypothetical protein